MLVSKSGLSTRSFFVFFMYLITFLNYTGMKCKIHKAYLGGGSCGYPTLWD